MKKNKDIVHDEDVLHNKASASSCSNSTSSTKVTLPNQLLGEKRCHSKEEAERHFGIKVGGFVWAYSSMYEAWFFGKIIGDNSIAVEIQSNTYKEAQIKANLEHGIKDGLANGQFFASRLADKFTKIY